MAKATILIIEDNELNAKLVRCLLEVGGYRVLEALDAETGIALTRRHHPDLVLMDIQLSGMDGLSATRLMKQEPSLKSIPVVALTSYAMEHDEKKALNAGCEGYITKPIDTRSFLNNVEQYIKNRTPL